MLCYCCAEEGTDRPAVALCRDCNAGLCMTHLRQTTARLAAGNLFASCGHDTLIATGRPERERVITAARRRTPQSVHA